MNETAKIYHEVMKEAIAVIKNKEDNTILTKNNLFFPK
jgi:hypothetical protein